MTFLPIVARELRVASRRRGAWLTRLTAAFVGVLVGVFVMMVSESDQTPAAIGKDLFTTVAGFLFIYAIISGALVTCDCLAEEKREGTLGLLFLTDLKGYDVVFGKLAATSMNTIYGMLAVVPLMAIPILMGGVANAEFWRVVIVALNLLLLSLSVGILSSSLSRSDHRAMLFAAVIVGVLIIAPWLLSLRGWGRAGSKAEWIAVLSPATSCFVAFDDNIRTAQERSTFWTSVACTQIYFWLFLLIACRVVPRSWQETGERFAQRGIWTTLRQLLEGQPNVRAARRTRMLDINPYFWRAARKRTKDILVWLLIAGGALLWYWIRPRGMDSLFDFGRDIFVIVLVNAALKWWVASEAARHLSEDRRNGGLELLLSTPLSEDEIVRGQRRALLHQFAGPVAAVLLADFIFLLVALKHSGPGERTGMLLFYMMLGVSLVFDLVALSIVGMWLGLSGRKTNRATVVGLVRIIVLPTVGFTVITTIVSVAAPQSNISPIAVGFFWIALCTVTNVIFMTSAQKHLRHFRDAVAQRFTTRVAERKTAPPTVAQPKAIAANLSQT